MKNIKLYDIHGPSTIENFRTLITPDNKYFYWDSKRFTRNEIGDIVFWVNRTERVVLYTIIDSKDIRSSFNNGRNLINDLGNNVSATAQDETKFETFYRFKIIEKALIPDGWNYSNLVPFNGQTMAIILYEPHVNDPEKKIEKIKDLKPIFHANTEVTEILDEALALLNGNNLPVRKSKQQHNTSEFRDMNIFTAIKTKPFILLAGLSGTGKSRLVRTLAYKTCGKEELRKDPKKPGNFELIPVRPNWHDSSELMGYISRINGEKYITTSFLQFIAKAWRNINIPFFLCLDEMNLAPVEQYFAEYLSIIESRQVQDKVVVTDFLISKASFENKTLYTDLLKDLELNDQSLFFDGISIPHNLVIIGTVNMDETTHSFSRKVLDRAMTFEMNHVDLNAGLDNTKNDWSYPEDYISSSEVIGDYTSGAEVVNAFQESTKVIDFLIKLNAELEGTPFKIAYRVRDEFLIYCYYASLNSIDPNWLTNALDEMTTMKILSRIEGDETKTGAVLRNLQRVLTSDYKKSNTKIIEMETRLSTTGYTSFWS